MFLDIIEQGAVVERALVFAFAAHAAAENKRKYSGEDYINHPIDVCRILIGRGITDQEMLAAALLHDVIEDTGVTFDQLSQMFSAPVVELVRGLTDVSVKGDGNRKVRKAKDRQHTAESGPRVQTIKYADCISNARSIKTEDPGFWRDFKVEIKALLDVANEGDAVLHRQALFELGMLTDIKVTYFQHIPSFAHDARETVVTGTVSSAEDLLAVDFICAYIKPGFDRFKLFKPSGYPHAQLMATFTDGNWWTVARLEGDYSYLGLEDLVMASKADATFYLPR